MIDLNRQITKFDVVINFPLKKRICDALDELSKNIECHYFMIIHDKDYRDDGSIKTKHIHLGLIFEKRKRVSTIISYLSITFGCVETCIQVQEMMSVSGSIQYLTHKNDASKYQYDFNDIKTNFNETDFLSLYNQQVTDFSITPDLLYDLIVTKKFGLLDVIRSIGLSKYVHYRSVVLDFYTYYCSGVIQ